MWNNCCGCLVSESVVSAVTQSKIIVMLFQCRHYNSDTSKKHNKNAFLYFQYDERLCNTIDQCVYKKNVCDKQLDCKDNSDEYYCTGDYETSLGKDPVE